MKLIVGLGNPGIRYLRSRHNIGYQVVKALSKFYKAPLKRDKNALFLSAKIKVEGQGTIIAIPLTFMNLSGSAVAGLIRKYKVDLNNLLIICDDLDLEFSRIKLKSAGSSGGHRGLESIIESLGTPDFTRLRIGIGRPLGGIDPAKYVLSRFSGQEMKELKKISKRALECCESWVTKGKPQTMNIFNKKEQ